MLPDDHDTEAEHTHSRMRKMLDEVAAVVEAARSNGTFESHHHRDLSGFLDRLRTNFDEHADYEESELFEQIRPSLDEDAQSLIDRAIDQHEQFADLLDRAESRFDELEVGTATDNELFRGLADDLAQLQRIWSDHDEVERQVFGEYANAGSM